MRVTNGMLQSGTMYALYNNMNSLDRLFTQMSTLKQIERPSDDPIIAGRSLKLQIDINGINQYETNVEEAMSWMEVTDGATMNITDILKEVKTRANYAATGTLTKEDKEKVLADIAQLSEQIKAELNTSYAGRYVFSGFKTGDAVYLEDDTNLIEDVTTASDMFLSSNMTIGNQSMTVGTDGMEIAEPGMTVVGNDITTAGGTTYTAGDTIPVGEVIPAGTVLEEGTIIPKNTKLPEGTKLTAGTIVPKGTANPKVVGNIEDDDIKYEIGSGVEIEVNENKMAQIMVVGYEQLLKDLTGAIEENDSEKISALIEDVDDVMSQVGERMADGGSRQTRLEFTLNRTTEEKTTFTELLSETEDIDIEDVYVEFNAQMAVYQSALQASSKIVINTLADYM